jgi:hypothetical protein
MIGAAAGVWAAATITQDAMVALATVLTCGSILALILYQLRARSPAG